MTREEINAFGEKINALHLDGDKAVLVAVGSHAPTADCPVVSAIAIVRGGIGGPELHEFSGNAVHLEDAIWIARGKLRAARKAHEAERAKKKVAA